MKHLFSKFLVAFLLTSAVVLSWSEYFLFLEVISFKSTFQCISYDTKSLVNEQNQNIIMMVPIMVSYLDQLKQPRKGNLRNLKFLFSTSHRTQLILTSILGGTQFFVAIIMGPSKSCLFSKILKQASDKALQEEVLCKYFFVKDHLPGHERCDITSLKV